MSHLRLRASRFATTFFAPAASRGAIHRAHFPLYCASKRPFSLVSQALQAGKKKAFIWKPLVKQRVRHCSHRRNMCRNNLEMPSGSMDIAKHREVLPTNVKPLHYDLTLEPDFEKFTYVGTVVIEYVFSAK